MEKLNTLYFTSENTYKNRLTVALRAARICIYEVDLTRQLYTFFENAEDIFGISGEEILAHVQPYSALDPAEYQKAVLAYFAHPDDAEVIGEAFDCVLRGQQTTYEARMRRKDSAFVWCKLDVVPVLENGRPVRMIGVITDISEVRKQREVLEQKANLDGFTGLWNKKYAISSIRTALAQEPEGRHALLVLDVDGFKRFNDTYGHAKGDRILLAISDRLTGTFHENSIVGRFGGDEFIVFVQNIRSGQDLECLYRKIKSISRVEADGLSAAISIGTAVYPEDGADFETLFEQADRLLYQEKLGKRHSASFRRSPEPEAQEEGGWIPLPNHGGCCGENPERGVEPTDESHQI